MLGKTNQTFKKLVYAGIVASVLLAGASGKATSAPDSNSIVVDDIEFYIETDKSIYYLGENVEMLYRLTKLGFPSATIPCYQAPPLNLVVLKDGKTVWMKVQNWWQWVGDLQLFPKIPVEITSCWEMNDLNDVPVEPGIYDVLGVIYTGIEIPDVGVQITILPEPRTITVGLGAGYDFNTIQAAIDNSNDGDTVIVADGIYMGEGNRDIEFSHGLPHGQTRSITVRSANGPENCIIDCNGTETDRYRGFIFQSGEDANSVINGFTITNGYAPTEDIPPILDTSVGGAIYNQHSSPTVTNCKFVSNSADYGGGMYNDHSNPIVTKCAFSENSACCGGGMSNALSSPTVTNCTFRDNSASCGGGIYIGSMSFSSISYPFISNCFFIGNSAGDGGGMYIERGNPTVTNCTFSDNSAGENGGGIGIFLPCFPAFRNCIFTGNSAGYYGGGIYNYFSGPCLTNCTFIANSVERDGGGLFHCMGSPTLANCIFRANMDSGGTDESAQIYSLATPLLVNYSCIKGWTGSLGGAGNFDVDPCFADPNNGDFHLKSQAGRWNPLTLDWVTDDVTSLCIDAGDPASLIGYEPFPNGGITNMGAYGGTVEASKSYFGGPVCETIVAGDVNGDCKVNFLDFRIMAFHWLECTAPKCKRIIEVSAATNKSTYLLGEDVIIFVTAYNPNAEAVTLHFVCMVASYLMDGVFDYAEVPWTPWPFHEVTIESHSSHTFKRTHKSYGYPLGIGIHTVVGEVLGYGYSEPVDFEVIPE